MSWFCNKNVFSTRPLPCCHLCQGWKRPAQTGLCGRGGLLSALGWWMFPGPELLSCRVGPGHVLCLCASCPPPGLGHHIFFPCCFPSCLSGYSWVGKLPSPRSEIQCFCVYTAWGQALKTSVQASSCLGIPGVLCSCGCLMVTV